ncbi:hypothetical protein Hanom_Chr13g01226211 [Helianthus anomalus]
MRVKGRRIVECNDGDGEPLCWWCRAADISGEVATGSLLATGGRYVGIRWYVMVVT